MKKLPDLLEFCLVCLAGPAVNDNTVNRYVKRPDDPDQYRTRNDVMQVNRIVKQQEIFY